MDVRWERRVGEDIEDDRLASYSGLAPDREEQERKAARPAQMTGSYTHSSPQAMGLAMELVAVYSREKFFSLTANSRQSRMPMTSKTHDGGVSLATDAHA